MDVEITATTKDKNYSTTFVVRLYNELAQLLSNNELLVYKTLNTYIYINIMYV